MQSHEPEFSWPPNPSFARLGLIPLVVVFALAMALVAYPPMRGMETDGAEKSAFKDSTVTAFRYFAVDTFYYLGVAERSAGAGMYTFDGEHRTNGFHPLWQYFLTYSFRIFGLVDSQASQIAFAFGASILFAALGCGFVAMTVWRLTRSLPLSLFIVAPGPYFILTRLHGMGNHYGSMWSYINGMESPFTIFFFGAILFLLATRFVADEALSRRDAFVLGVLGGLMTLSRLDDIFIFFGLLVAFIAFAEDKKSVERFLRAGIMLAPAGVLVCGYILFNLVTMGIPMPVSGIAKAGLAIFANILDSIQMFIPFDLATESPFRYVDMTWRALQTCLPAALALLVIVPIVQRLRADRETALFSLGPAQKLLFVVGIYIVIKALYNTINVKFVHQGHWYYPAAVIYANLVMIIGLRAIWESAVRAELPTTRGPLISIVILLFIAFATIQFTNLKRTDSYQLNLYRAWKSGPEIAQTLRGRYDGKGIIEFDDGILSYAMKTPAMSGLGFTLDREAFEAKERGELLKVAYDRGYRVFVSMQYAEYIPREVLKDPNLLRDHFRFYWVLRNTALTRAENVDLWDFKVVAVHEKPALIFFEFKPRAPLESGARAKN